MVPSEGVLKGFVCIRLDTATLMPLVLDLRVRVFSLMK